MIFFVLDIDGAPLELVSRNNAISYRASRDFPWKKLWKTMSNGVKVTNKLEFKILMLCNDTYEITSQQPSRRMLVYCSFFPFKKSFQQF
jgi:hypothetical protein